MSRFAPWLVVSLLLMSAPARAGQFELLSTAGAESDTAEGAVTADLPLAISADGRWTAFASTARNLVTGQMAGQHGGQSFVYNVFLHDRQTGTTALVSHAAGSPTLPGNGSSWEPSISADGRWVAFQSQAGNLVPGQDTASLPQVFLYDRDTGANVLVSHSVAGPLVEASGSAAFARVSGDGSRVAFQSTGDNLVPGQVKSVPGYSVYLYERATGEIVLVSRAAGLHSTARQGEDASLSADGRYVSFRSTADDLIPGFTRSGFDFDNVFLFDRMTGTVTLVSHASASATEGVGGKSAMVSADGSSVAFMSRDAGLVAGQTDANGWYDAFLFQRATGTNILVSRSTASPATAGNAGLRDLIPLRVSATGAYVAFLGNATDAVPGQIDPGSSPDIFLFERATSSLTLVSRTSASPVTAAASDTNHFSLSADGRFVAFRSRAANLVPGQSGTGGWPDIFLFDRTAGTNVLVSGAAGSGQVTGSSDSNRPAISADGAVVAFQTWAKDLDSGTTDLNTDPDVALWERASGTTTIATLHAPGMASASAGAFSMLSSVSADGRYAVLLSWSENLAPGQVDDNWEADVFLVDRMTGTTALVSRSAASQSSLNTAAKWEAGSAVISADGGWVLFSSIATDLVPGQAGIEGYPHVFLYERATGAVTLVSHAAGAAATTGNQGCGSFDWIDGYFPAQMALSADGRYIVFECQATNLVPGQTTQAGSWSNVFLHDRVTGQTSLVSRAAAAAATTGNRPSRWPRISSDGRYVSFSSHATDLVPGSVDGNDTEDVFLYDRITGQVLLASRAAGTAATAANAGAGFPELSADGRFVVFDSTSTNLVPGQADPSRSPYTNDDVFLFDRVTGMVELISRAAGSATATGNDMARRGVPSADGRHVLYGSSASNVVPGQSKPVPYSWDLFLHDRVTRKTELITRAASSPVRSSEGVSGYYTLSPDGRFVSFLSEDRTLTPKPAGNTLFIADRQLRTLERVSKANALFYNDFEATLESLPRLSADGSTAFFTSDEPGLVEGDYNHHWDTFAYERTSSTAGSDFFTVVPCRLLDTRLPADGPALTSDLPGLLAVHGACGIPENATAVAVNVTVVQPSGPGQLTVHPGNLQGSATSTISFAAGQTRSNNAILALAFNGEGTLGLTPLVAGEGTVHVIVDVSGYFR